MSRRVLILATLFLTFCSAGACLQGIVYDPEDSVIHYYSSEQLADPGAKLQQKIASGQANLRFEQAHGYLASLLQALQIPISSQALVFSKTSLKTDHVGPRTPRAVYFNDNVYVSWVPGGEEIDLSAVDPHKGPIFYILKQLDSAAPHFERRTECTGCHLGPKTLNVPGHLMRSVITGPDGYPLSQLERFTIGHSSPMDQRWGGWYVTAIKDPTMHFGNVLAPAREQIRDVRAIGSIPDLRNQIDIGRYLASGSDIAALLVLTHQLKMHNLITRANYETRFALAEDGISSPRTRQRIVQVAEPLLEYMLFRDETPLPGPIQGTSTFARDFQRLGPRDSKGRSLRDLDLRTRLLRYPCSYLIYSEAFDGLPPQLREYLWRRLVDILEGRDSTGVFSGMPANDRLAVLEILRDTKPAFAAVLQAEERRDLSAHVTSR